MELVVVLGEVLAMVVGWPDEVVELVVRTLLCKMFAPCWYLRSKAENTVSRDKSSKYPICLFQVCRKNNLKYKNVRNVS